VISQTTNKGRGINIPSPDAGKKKTKRRDECGAKKGSRAKSRTARGRKRGNHWETSSILKSSKNINGSTRKEGQATVSGHPDLLRYSHPPYRSTIAPSQAFSSRGSPGRRAPGGKSGEKGKYYKGGATNWGRIEEVRGLKGLSLLLSPIS